MCTTSLLQFSSAQSILDKKRYYWLRNLLIHQEKYGNLVEEETTLSNTELSHVIIYSIFSLLYKKEKDFMLEGIDFDENIFTDANPWIQIKDPLNDLEFHSTKENILPF